MRTASSPTSSPAEAATPPPPAEDPPPFLGSWRRVYGLVLAELALSVLLFWLITRWAS